MKISILIVNYNTERCIADFLTDLTQQSLKPQDFEIIVVNNVQNNHLEHMLAAPHLATLPLKMIASSQNIGFGRAMNLAANAAQGEHLLIANPDLRLLQTEYLEQLILATQQHPHYGVMTTQILNDAQQDLSEFYNFEFHETFGITERIKWFSGALLLIPRTVYQQVQGFDPDFFMYCEDEDLCLRIRQLNLAFIKLDQLKIYHQGGSSEPNQGYDYFYRWYRSQILFAYKHFTAEKFQRLLQQLGKKSAYKVPFYRYLSAILPTQRHKFQYAQWSAMQDVIAKTCQSTAWLAFRL